MFKNIIFQKKWIKQIYFTGVKGCTVYMNGVEMFTIFDDSCVINFEEIFTELFENEVSRTGSLSAAELMYLIINAVDFHRDQKYYSKKKKMLNGGRLKTMELQVSENNDVYYFIIYDG